MEPWQEPVRGAPMPHAGFALSGFEQLRAASRGMFAPPPTFHLVGMGLTHVGHGVTVSPMPASPWLQHGNGTLVFLALSSNAGATAATTTLPAGLRVKPKMHTYVQLRHGSADGRPVMARARVVHSTPSLIFTEISVEDGDGRVLAQALEHLLVVPVDPPPGDPPVLERVELPTHPTPDPYLRPLPADKALVLDAFLERSGRDATLAVFAGELPRPPIYELLGIRGMSSGMGHAEMTMVATEWLLTGHPGLMLPGWIETLAVEAAGNAVYTMVDEPGLTPTVLSSTFLHLDVVEPKGQVLRATGTAERVADDLMAVSVVVAEDGGGRVATATLAATLVPLMPRQRSEATRVLATVLFTDVVGSTEQASRLGDQKWGELLERHHELIRRELDRFQGHFVKSTGDGVLATFDSPSRAVECARAIRNVVRALGFEIRAGLHAGEIEVSGGDVAGVVVHTAARIEATAEPGEVWVSDTVKALATGSGSGFKDQGRHALKGIDDDVQLYSVED